MNDVQLELDLFEDDGWGLTHVMMPNMRAACGWCVCGCSGTRGHFIVGAGHDWDKVTCDDCRSWGQDTLIAASRKMQERQA